MTTGGTGKLNPMVVAFIAGSMQATGLTLENLDENVTGTDDLIGILLASGSEAFQGFMLSSDAKVDRAAVAIARASASYCKARGLTV